MDHSVDRELVKELWSTVQCPDGEPLMACGTPQRAVLALVQFSTASILESGVKCKFGVVNML